jgi:hypothetical protein
MLSCLFWTGRTISFSFHWITSQAYENCNLSVYVSKFLSLKKKSKYASRQISTCCTFISLLHKTYLGKLDRFWYAISVCTCLFLLANNRHSDVFTCCTFISLLHKTYLGKLDRFWYAISVCTCLFLLANNRHSDVFFVLH